jgi:D-glycero-alpha-D-manno-heptose 1-phosphate guanylyltransferase
MSTAIILAGGLGARLRSAVPDLAKPMAPINGKPFLEHQMDYWIAQGIDHFVLSVGYRKEDIIEHFGKLYKGCQIEYAMEEQPLGTGGGFLKAINLIDQNESVLVLNGDTFFEIDYDQLKRYHEQKGSQWTFSLFRANEAERYMGMDIGPDGDVLSLKSGTRELGCLANGGVYLVNPNVIAGTRFKSGDKASLEDDILSDLMAQHIRLYGIEFAGRFIDASSVSKS